MLVFSSYEQYLNKPFSGARPFRLFPIAAGSCSACGRCLPPSFRRRFIRPVASKQLRTTSISSWGRRWTGVARAKETVFPIWHKTFGWQAAKGADRCFQPVCKWIIEHGGVQHLVTVLHFQPGMQARQAILHQVIEAEIHFLRRQSSPRQEMGKVLAGGAAIAQGHRIVT
jgi:hypothetical protein